MISNKIVCNSHGIISRDKGNQRSQTKWSCGCSNVTLHFRWPYCSSEAIKIVLLLVTLHSIDYRDNKVFSSETKKVSPSHSSLATFDGFKRSVDVVIRELILESSQFIFVVERIAKMTRTNLLIMPYNNSWNGLVDRESCSCNV